MKIVHFSDIHVALPPDSLSACFDKRMLGTLNYALRRRFLHDQTLLSRLGEFILDQTPDVVVCTGDLTSTGQPAEFQIALKALRPIMESTKIKLLYVPGNHDAYVRNPRCASALADTFVLINGDTATLADLPVVKTVAGIEFILVNEAFPTNIFLSNGKITSYTDDAVRKICSTEKKHPRILLGHFPLTQKQSLRHGLENATPMRELLENGSIDLSLCGHTHKPSTTVDDTGRGEAVAGSFTRTRDIIVVDYSSKTDVFDIQTKTLEPVAK